MVAGFPGAKFDNTGQVLTAVNLTPEAKQITTVTVGTGGAQTMTLLINGFPITAVGTGGDTTAQNATKLADAINANTYVSGVVVAEASAATVIVTSRFGGRAFTLVETAGDLTPVATQANAEAAPIPYGRLVVRTGNASNEESTVLCGLAAASLLTAQEDNLALTYDAAVGAKVSIKYYDPAIGEYVTRAFEHTQATDADTSVVALHDQINAVMPANTILASHGTADTLTLTSEVAGVPFEVEYGFGTGRDTGAWVHTTNSTLDATNVNRLLLGLNEWTATNENVDVAGEPAIPGGSICAIKSHGRNYVLSEDAAVVGKPVFLRLVANGALDKLGGLRATPNAGCIRLDSYRWHKELGSKVNAGTNLAVVENY